MTRVLGIDPGPTRSAFVLFNGERVVECEEVENEELRRRLRDRTFGGPGFVAVIEQVEAMGMVVGRDVFETVFWSGRLFEVAGIAARVTRHRVKLHLCNSRAAKDKNVRQALIDRFGGDEVAIGRKKAQGPLYGVSGHCWAALAVAVTYYDLREENGFDGVIG